MFYLRFDEKISMKIFLSNINNALSNEIFKLILLEIAFKQFSMYSKRFDAFINFECSSNTIAREKKLKFKFLFRKNPLSLSAITLNF